MNLQPPVLRVVSVLPQMVKRIRDLGSEDMPSHSCPGGHEASLPLACSPVHCGAAVEQMTCGSSCVTNSSSPMLSALSCSGHPLSSASPSPSTSHHDVFLPFSGCAVCNGLCTYPEEDLDLSVVPCGVCGCLGCGQAALHDPRCVSFPLRHSALHALWEVFDVLSTPGSAVSLGNYNPNAACGELAKVVMHLLNALHMNSSKQHRLPYRTPFGAVHFIETLQQMYRPRGLGSYPAPTMVHGDWIRALQAAALILDNSSYAVRPISLAALFNTAADYVSRLMDEIRLAVSLLE